MNKQKAVNSEQAGYAPAEWCQSASISRAGFYNLPADLQPRSVKLGRRRIITESPSAYLERIADMQKRAA